MLKVFKGVVVDSKNLFSRFASDGFIKQGPRAQIDSEQRVQLNRKGNILFKRGEIEAARRIFLTTGYSDGLSRIGDWYHSQGRELDALRMYWLAPNRGKAQAILEKLSVLIQKLIHEDEDDDRA